MTEPAAAKKRGRKSKAEEARAYLRTLGVDPDTIIPPSAAEDPMPETDAEMLDEFKALLWRGRHELQGTAFTNALNALARFAEASKGDDDRAGAQPTVAEIIAGNVLLPAERKREILEEELVALEVERAAIAEVLDVLLA